MKLLTGFRDFFPEECARRNYIASVWNTVARRYGFAEYDGPPLEELELFTRKSGDEIVGQLYNFIDKGDRPVALRPEMTPTLARMVGARARDFKKPIKWFSIPQVFRYERPQKGRLREHYQYNCDILGEADTNADIELMALCIDVLREFGLTSEDFVVRISDRQFWIDFLEEKSIPEPEWYAVLQAIDKSERQPREKTAEQLGALADDVFAILDNGAKSERIDAVIQGLADRGMGEFALQDLTIVRGLAYYTGIVFEVFDRKGENRAIAAGGRYDTLLENLGFQPLPALGFGMGDVVLGNMLAEHPVASDRIAAFAARQLATDVYVVIAEEDQRPNAMRLVQDLRGAGLRVVFPFTPAKVGKQLKIAEQANAAHAVIVGSEWPTVQVKTLATRQELALPAAEACGFLAKKSC